MMAGCVKSDAFRNRLPAEGHRGAARNHQKKAGKILQFKSPASQEEPAVSRLFDADCAASKRWLG